jgi:hypothetical protein
VSWLELLFWPVLAAAGAHRTGGVLIDAEADAGACLDEAVASSQTVTGS